MALVTNEIERAEFLIWSYLDFERNVLDSAREALNGRNLPDAIDYSCSRIANEIGILDALTAEQGVEFGMPIFSREDTFVFGERVTEKEINSVLLDKYSPLIKQEEDPILYFHSHIREKGGRGFSPEDFGVLILKDSLKGIFLIVDGCVFCVLKNSFSICDIDNSSLRQRLNLFRTEFEDQFRIDFVQAVFDFNRGVCLEFGLAMYMSSSGVKDRLVRIPVV